MKSNKRPYSCYNKGFKNNQFKKRHVAVNCDNRAPSSSTHNDALKGIFINDNKKYTVSPNSYVDKFNSQIKRINMYNEMWNQSLSEDEDFYGISQSIKIQPENKKNDNSISTDKYRVNATNTRVSSAATTYCDIGYRSKRLIKGLDSNLNNNNYNINTISKKSVRNNNKISANIIKDINKNNYNFINSYSNYNTKSTSLYNRNTFNSVGDNKNKDYGGATGTIGTYTNNFTNTSNDFINKFPNKDFITKEEKTIGDTENRKTIDIEDKEALKKVINDCNTTTLKLRTEYLIKLSKLLEMSKKFSQYSDYFRVEKRDLFHQSIKNLSTSFDKCNDLILNEIKTGEVLDLKSWAKILVCYFNFSFSLIKYQKDIFNEMHFIKTENLNLKQKLFLQEVDLTTKNKDINDINKYIMQYDLTNKVKYGKKKELSIKEIKQKYISQESAYILTIYKLEEEIKQLTNVLEKNKYDVNNFKMVSEKLKQVEQEYDRDKEKLEHQNDEKDIENKLLSQTIVDLNEKLAELENEIQQLKNKEEKEKHNYIGFEAKIKNLNDIINNKNEIIEELEKENKAFKEKKSNDNKMLEPVDTVFIPMKEKIRKRKKI